MLRKLLLLIQAVFLISFVQGQNLCRNGFVTDESSPNFGLSFDGSCICKLDRIFFLERELSAAQADQQRTYTLCPGQTFEMGTATAEGNIVNGDIPIAVRRNVVVQCGTSGASSNDCKLDGTGSFAIFLSPFDTFFGETDQGTVEFKGLTIDFFINDDQVPVVMVFETGRVTFDDCIFSNIEADPLMAMDELDPSTRPARRDLSETNFTGPFHYKAKTNRNNFFGDNIMSGGGRSLVQAQDTTNTITNADDLDSAVAVHGEEDHRELQNSGFRIVFRDCQFTGNSGVFNARSQAGLNILRVRKAKHDGFDADGLATADVTLNDCQFEDNKFDLDNDQAFYRGMIDFYSNGRLSLRRNTFLNSGVKKIAPIVLQQASRLISTSNNLFPVQSGLSCSFMARVDAVDYNVLDCDTQGFTSNAPAPTPAPGGGGGGGGLGICFPNNAQVQVLGVGNTPMRALQIGDKVMVENGKFEPIYSFAHLEKERMQDYLEISTATTVIKISAAHMISLEGGQFVPSSMVNVGDKLRLAGGQVGECTGVKVIREQGAYAPLTPSGTIVVDGIIASTFVTFQDSPTVVIDSFDTGLSFQYLEHSFEAPHRFYCSYISKCDNESYNSEGISTWAAIPLSWCLWFFQQQPFVMAVVTVPLVTVLTAFAYPLSTAATLALLILGRRQALGIRPATKAVRY